MKKVLIFYISDFGGHSKAASNIAEALVYRNYAIKPLCINGLKYFYPQGDKIINLIYALTIKHFPHLWGKIYDRKKIIKTLSPLRRKVNFRSFNKLNSLIKEFQPQCVVATQAFPCGLVADYKEKYNLRLPLIAIVTDYHPHRFWIHPYVDKYVVACQEAKDFLIREGIAEEKVKILGIPISVNFLNTYPRVQLTKELGFLEDIPCILIMGGGWGLGPIKKIVHILEEVNYPLQMAVVCGKNISLYNWFKKNATNFKKPVHYFPYIDYVYKIMDISDIVITKAGGITVSEALAKGLGIIITQPIPGQEEKNVEYLSCKKAAIILNNLSDLEEILIYLLGNKKHLYLLKQRAKSISIVDSSLRIVDLIMEAIS